MKRIAMLNCLNAGEVCAGVSCMSAFNDRKASFAAYGGEALQLTAFMRCNGCGRELLSDKGMLEKLERIIKSGTDAVHIGVCTKKPENGHECEQIAQIAAMLDNAGIMVVRGTH